MSRILIVCLFVFAAPGGFGQDLPKGVSKASAAYDAYRQTDSNPPYGLAMIKRLIAAIKPVSKPDSDEQTRALSDRAFNALSVAEKFTYCMLHGEDFVQNCDMMAATVSEEKKIFAQIPGDFGDGGTWSDRQTAFFQHHRGSVISLLRATIRAKNRVGLNLKHAILEVDGYELIPDLLAVYNRTRKDHDILTVFLLMMDGAKYEPFLSSPIYKKLYADENASYKSFISYTAQNEKLALGWATAFYKSQKAK